MAERGSGLGMGGGKAGAFGGASKGSFGGASRGSFGGAERGSVATLSRPSIGSERATSIGPSSVRNKFTIGGLPSPRFDKGLAARPEFGPRIPRSLSAYAEFKTRTPNAGRRPNGIERAFPNTRMMPLPESRVSNAANGGRSGNLSQEGLRNLLRQPNYTSVSQNREVSRQTAEVGRIAPFDARPINSDRRAQQIDAGLPKGFAERATAIRRELQKIQDQQLQASIEVHEKSKIDSESRIRNVDVSKLSQTEPTSPAGKLRLDSIIRERRRLGLPVSRARIDRALQQGAAFDEREDEAVQRRLSAYNRRIAGYFNRQLRIVTGASVGEADTYLAKSAQPNNESGSLQAAAWFEFFKERKKKRKDKGLLHTETGVSVLPTYLFNRSSGRWDDVTHLLVRNPNNWEEVRQAVKKATGRLGRHQAQSATQTALAQQTQAAMPELKLQTAAQTDVRTSVQQFAQETLATQASVKNSVAATPEMLLKLQAVEQQARPRDEVVLFLRIEPNGKDDLPKVHDKMANNARANTAQTVIANTPSNEAGLISGEDVAFQINKARSDSLLSGLVKKYGSKFDGSLEAFIEFFAKLGNIIKGNAHRSVGEAIGRYPAVLEGNGERKATQEQVRLVLEGKRSKEETFALAA